MRRQQRAANVRRMTRTFSKVEVLIEALALPGFSSAEGYALGEALSQELEQLFKEAELDSAFAQEARLPLLDAGQIVVSPNAKPVSVGRQVAQAVHGSLNKSGRGNQR